MTMMTDIDGGGGRRANDATDSTNGAVHDGGRQDHGAVNSANRAANTRADGTADNVANRASDCATTIGAFLSTADDALGMGGERHCKRRHQRHGRQRSKRLISCESL